jgi:anti-anti-sigma factor
VISELTVPTDTPPQLPAFRIAVDDDGYAHVAISGDLDLTTAAALADQLAKLADLRPTRLVIDMSGVTFLDCASARLLAGASAFLPPGRQLVLTSVRPPVRRLLELTGLAEVVHIAG